jgi:hypothetical protein
LRLPPTGLAWQAMPAITHVVRDAQGREAGALFDLPLQGKVALRIEDDELARFLVERGIAPPRPPFLDAGGRSVRGAYAARPQRNWFLAPPLDGVVAALTDALSSSPYSLAPATAPA